MRRFFDDDVLAIASIGTGLDIFSVLGRAILAAATQEGNPRLGLVNVVNHSGRSAMTGATAGALLGARLDVAGLPQDWLDAVDLSEIAQEMGNDSYWHFARRIGTSDTRAGTSAGGPRLVGDHQRT